MKTIVNKFKDIVQRHPNNIAINSGDKKLSYEKLNEYANKVANSIRTSTENHHNNIALLFDHSEDMIIGILGVLKAGRTYVPIDPLYPLERAQKIIKDSGSFTLITNTNELSLAHKLVHSSGKEIKIINISDLGNESKVNPELKIKEDQAAYILYTSGSTGQPKGVVQSHQTIVHSIDNYINELDIKESDNVLLTTSYSHTVSVIDIFSGLFAGASLTLLNVKKDFNAQFFGEWINKMDVSIIHVVPTLYRYAVKFVDDRSLLRKVRLVILGGEEVFLTDVELYKEKFPDNCLFINLYGSSEVILGTLHVIDKNYSDTRKVIPIGYPFENIEAHVLDENKNESQVHSIGEIYFKGEFLNPKYYNDPTGTDKLFSYKGNSDDRLIKMGDLAKFLPDGSLLLMGRKDNQVKINGNRVELLEIEIALNSDKAIEQSVVMPLKNEKGELFLVAYITVTEEIPNIENIKEELRKKLPEYMIPSFFVKLSKMPLTPNGKIDRNALPKVDYKKLIENFEAKEKTELQEKILKLWKETFEREDITIHDNFFQLGGNSLLATELVSKIYNITNEDFELNVIFDNQSVYEIAKFIESRKSSNENVLNENMPVKQTEKKEYYELGLEPKGLMLLRKYKKDQRPDTIVLSQKIKSLNKDILKKTFDQIMQRHEIFRSVFIPVENDFKLKVIPFKDFKYNIEYSDQISHRSDPNKIVFDLEHGPLFKIWLFDLGNEESLLEFIIMHIITDGWSIKLLLSEFYKLYEANILNKPYPLPELKIQYKDYINWLNKLDKHKQGIKLKEYWENVFKNKIPDKTISHFISESLEIKRRTNSYKEELIYELRKFVKEDITDEEIKQFLGVKESVSPKFKGAGFEFYVDKKHQQLVYDLIANEKTTLLVFILACYNILCYKYAGLKDNIQAVIAAVRDHNDISNIAGLILNNIFIRNEINEEFHFKEFLEIVNKNLKGNTKKLKLSFSKIIELFRHAYESCLKSHSNYREPVDRKILPGDLIPKHIKQDFGPWFDLYSSIHEYHDGIEVLHYDARLFMPKVIEKLWVDYLGIINNVAENPDLKIQQIFLKSPFDFKNLLF